MARVASMFVLLFTMEILLVNLLLTDVLNHVWFTIIAFYIPFSLGVLLDTGVAKTLSKLGVLLTIVTITIFHLNLVYSLFLGVDIMTILKNTPGFINETGCVGDNAIVLFEGCLYSEFEAEACSSYKSELDDMNPEELDTFFLRQTSELVNQTHKGLETLSNIAISGDNFHQKLASSLLVSKVVSQLSNTKLDHLVSNTIEQAQKMTKFGGRNKLEIGAAVFTFGLLTYSDISQIPPFFNTQDINFEITRHLCSLPVFNFSDSPVEWVSNYYTSGPVGDFNSGPVSDFNNGTAGNSLTVNTVLEELSVCPFPSPITAGELNEAVARGMEDRGND